MLTRMAEELLANPAFTGAVTAAVEKAMETKGRLDRNMETVLGLLNLPSRGDLTRLQTKLDVLHGSLVNLNIKVDRLLASRNGDESHRGDGPLPTDRPKPPTD